VIVMSAKVVDGVLRSGAPARAAVDEELRRHTMRNHTATHLLHATLRRMFGEDVHQAGSLVHAPNLRFDFTFGRALTPEELLPRGERGERRDPGERERSRAEHAAAGGACIGRDAPLRREVRG